jgi:hypothetical protein
LKKITQRFSQVLNHKGLSGMYIDYAETSAKGIQDVSIVQEMDFYGWKLTDMTDCLIALCCESSYSIILHPL